MRVFWLFPISFNGVRNHCLQIIATLILNVVGRLNTYREQNHLHTLLVVVEEVDDVVEIAGNQWQQAGH